MASAVWERSLKPFISHLKALIQRAACTDLLQNQNQKPLQFELKYILHYRTQRRTRGCELFTARKALENYKPAVDSYTICIRHTNPDWGKRKHFTFSLSQICRDFACETFVPNAFVADKLHSFSWRLTKDWVRDMLSWQTFNFARDPGSMCVCVSVWACVCVWFRERLTPCLQSHHISVHNQID